MATFGNKVCLLVCDVYSDLSNPYFLRILNSLMGSLDAQQQNKCSNSTKIPTKNLDYTSVNMLDDLFIQRCTAKRVNMLENKEDLFNSVAMNMVLSGET